MRIILITACMVGAALVSSCAMMPGSAEEVSGADTASMRASPDKAVSGKKIDRHRMAQSAGYRALHLCTGLFTSEMPESLVYATARISEDSPLTHVVDRQAKTVSVTYLEEMPPRIAVWRAGLGCTQLPIGAPIEASESLADLSPGMHVPEMDDQAWPMGDKNATRKLDVETDAALGALLDSAFEAESIYGGDTWGVAIVKDGKIVAERYSDGYGPHVSARTNSMCKSLSATIVGTGVQKGLVDVHSKAPLQQWRKAGDPRGQITLNELLHMSSGLYTQGAGNPQGDLYGSGAPALEVSVPNMVDALPGDRFVYAGSDTIMSVMAVKQATGQGDHFISYPYKELLWKMGMTRTVMETDWKNDFLGSGQCWSTARDFARFSLLYLNGGEWNGEQIIPKNWPDYVSTLAPAQPASHAAGKAGYGAQFWVYDEAQGMPTKGYSAAGAYGQFAMIVPGENLAVVRRGLDYDGAFNIAEFTADVIAALAE